MLQLQATSTSYCAATNELKNWTTRSKIWPNIRYVHHLKNDANLFFQLFPSVPLKLRRNQHGTKEINELLPCIQFIRTVLATEKNQVDLTQHLFWWQWNPLMNGIWARWDETNYYQYSNVYHYYYYLPSSNICMDIILILITCWI